MSLVGRDHELDILGSLLDGAREGRGSTLLVAGEPGIGKTHLARAFADGAATSGATVAWARCWEDDGAPALWPWIQLVRTLADDGADAPLLEAAERASGPSRVPSDAPHARFRLFDDVATFLRRRIGRGPVIAVVDDLQWADTSSLLLLRFLARELPDVPLVILGTFRDIEVSPGSERSSALRDIASENRILPLGGLDPDASAELLGTTLDRETSGELAKNVHDRCGGNPLFVIEFARLLRTSTATTISSAVPDGIRPVLERRIARLSQPTWALLSCAAVAGEEFRLDTVAAASDLPAERALELLDEAGTAQLVRPTDTAGRYAFTHALVRDALYESLPLTRRAALHARLGEEIERHVDAEDNLAELAHHFLQATDAGEAPRALDYSERAGMRAMEVLAYEEAAAHFARALDVLDVSGADDEHRTRLLLARGDACMASGDVPAARKAFEDTAQLAARRGRPDDLARAALGFGAGLAGFEVQMLDQRQIDLLEDALEALGDEDSALRAVVLGRLSIALSYRASTDRRLEFATEAVEVARRVGDRSALASALAAHCDAIAGPEHTERRLAEATEIVDIARASSDRPMELLGRRLRLVALLELGDVRAAWREIGAFEAVAESVGQPLYSWYVPLWRATRALFEGKLVEAEELAQEAARIGGRARSQNAPMLAVVIRWMIASQSKDYEAALVLGDEMGGFVSGYDIPYANVYRAWVKAAQGHLEEAQALIERTRDAIRAFPIDSEWLPESCQWAEAVATAGTASDARENYERLLPHRSRFGVEGIGAGLHGSVERHLGLLAAAASQPALAIEHLEAALRIHRELGAPLLVAITEEQYGRFLLERDPERAQQLLDQANTAFRSLGVDTEAAGAPHRASTPDHAFRDEGEFWTLAFDGGVVRMKDSKGLRDLATLLSRPGREVAALDLYSSRTTESPDGEGLGRQGHAGEQLDETARKAYTERLAALEDDIAEAETLGDDAADLRAERDAIAAELASAYGLGGRPRRTGDPAERARSAVTQRIRDTLRKIEREHPALARHLRASVQTGTFCSYRPEHPVPWAFRPRGPHA